MKYAITAAALVLWTSSASAQAFFQGPGVGAGVRAPVYSNTERAMYLPNE